MGALIGWFVAGLTAAAVGLWFSGEVKAVAHGIVKWVIRIAADRMPAEHQDRYYAEWLQVIEDTASPLMKVVSVISLWWSAERVARSINPTASKRLTLGDLLRLAELKLRLLFMGRAVFPVVDLAIEALRARTKKGHQDEAVLTLLENAWAVSKRFHHRTLQKADLVLAKLKGERLPDRSENEIDGD